MFWYGKVAHYVIYVQYNNGVLAGSEKISQLKCLLDFLEKYLDSPSCEIQLANGIGRPFELIRDKLHETRFAVLQDTCRNHPEFIRILFAGGFFCKFYPAITQNDRLLSHKNSCLVHVPGLLYFFFAQLLSHNVEAHVVLGASNPNHASRQPRLVPPSGYELRVLCLDVTQYCPK